MLYSFGRDNVLCLDSLCIHSLYPPPHAHPQGSGAGSHLHIHHFQYTVWPDHGVPRYPASVIKFVQTVQHHYSKDSQAPMVVHCRWVTPAGSLQPHSMHPLVHALDCMYLRTYHIVHTYVRMYFFCEQWTYVCGYVHNRETGDVCT